MKFALFVVVILLVLQAGAHEHNTIPYVEGDEIHMECKGPDGKWGKGLICHETGNELVFEYGKDKFEYCGWFLEKDEAFEFAKDVIQGNKHWSCRVPVSKDKSFYYPIEIPLWGVVEPTHIHVNQHMGFIFHADHGHIMGASVYPIQDRFQYTRKGTIVNLHGPIRWFSRHSWQPLVPSIVENIAAAASSSDFSSFNTLGACIFTSLMTMFVLTMFYSLRLKPALIKKYLKSD